MNTTIEIAPTAHCNHLFCTISYSTMSESHAWKLKIELRHNTEDPYLFLMDAEYHNWDAGRVSPLESQKLPSSNTWEEKNWALLLLTLTKINAS